MPAVFDLRLTKGNNSPDDLQRGQEKRGSYLNQNHVPDVVSSSHSHLGLCLESHERDLPYHICRVVSSHRLSQEFSETDDLENLQATTK